MATQKGRNWSSGDIVTAANLSSIERGVSAVAEEYTPTTWANGNTVTATALNNIEQGIVNAGGGSSDFSTVTVTVTNDSNDSVTMIGAFFDEGDVYGKILLGAGIQEMSLIVYKNASSTLYFDLGTTTITTITGAATKIGNAYVDVTGDCTITISNESSGGDR